MHGEFFVADAVEFDSNPTTHTHIRRFEERLRGSLDQHSLDTWRRGDPHRSVPIVVVVVSEHGEHFLADEERWFSVGKLFRTLRHGGADSPHSPQVVVAGIWLLFSGHLLFR